MCVSSKVSGSELTVNQENTSLFQTFVIYQHANNCAAECAMFCLAECSMFSSVGASALLPFHFRRKTVANERLIKMLPVVFVSCSLLVSCYAATDCKFCTIYEFCSIRIDDNIHRKSLQIRYNTALRTKN